MWPRPGRWWLTSQLLCILGENVKVVEYLSSHIDTRMNWKLVIESPELSHINRYFNEQFRLKWPFLFERNLFHSYGTFTKLKSNSQVLHLPMCFKWLTHKIRKSPEPKPYELWTVHNIYVQYPNEHLSKKISIQWSNQSSHILVHMLISLVT